MSARSVWSGTRPSRYHSVRAISIPFSRPAHMILIPCAPSRIAFCIARFIARRNMIRFSSCWPIESAMSCASISGLRISSMLRPTSPPIILRRSARSVSMSSPFFPVTTPGRALWIVTRALLAGRSIVMLPTEACASFFFRYSRILMSSISVGAKFLLFANHFEVQFRVTQRRKPVGCIFCPMNPSLFAVADGDEDVAGLLQDDVATSLGPRGEAAQALRLVDVDRLDLEVVDVGAVVVLGVGDRRLEHLLDDLRALLRAEGKNVERPVDGQAADLVGDQPALLGRKPDATQHCFGFHRDIPHFFAGAATFLSAEWPLKVRVSANSPSLWPTMFSDT